MSYSPAILKKTEKGNAIKKQQDSFFKPVIQAKLTINQPNDIYEQEADAIADKVMRKPLMQKMIMLFLARRVLYNANVRTVKKRKKNYNERKVTMSQGLLPRKRKIMSTRFQAERL
jgi:hypothetical protein